MPCNISDLARRIPGRSPSASRCASPMFVNTAISGCTIFVRRVISPKRETPISITATSYSPCRPMSETGMPICPFMLPGVLNTSYFPESAAASISFAVVLPTLPVTPINGMFQRFRLAAAICCMAASVSGTTMRGSPAAPRSSHSTASAPFCSTSGMYLCPSVFSPRSARKRLPSPACRLSVTMDEGAFVRVSSFPCHSPRQARSISPIVIPFISYTSSKILR